MSKSYNNTIEIFDEPDVDPEEGASGSSPTARPSRPPRIPTRARCSACSNCSPQPDDLAEVERRYREGGIGYGEVKTRLGEAIVERFAEPRERRAEWVAHPDRVAKVRAQGAEKARATARAILEKARTACGVG